MQDYNYQRRGGGGGSRVLLVGVILLLAVGIYYKDNIRKWMNTTQAPVRQPLPTEEEMKKRIERMKDGDTKIVQYMAATKIPPYTKITEGMIMPGIGSRDKVTNDQTILFKKEQILNRVTLSEVEPGQPFKEGVNVAEKGKQASPLAALPDNWGRIEMDRADIDGRAEDIKLGDYVALSINDAGDTKFVCRQAKVLVPMKIMTEKTPGSKGVDRNTSSLASGQAGTGKSGDKVVEKGTMLLGMAPEDILTIMKYKGRAKFTLIGLGSNKPIKYDEVKIEKEKEEEEPELPPNIPVTILGGKKPTTSSVPQLTPPAPPTTNTNTK